MGLNPGDLPGTSPPTKQQQRARGMAPPLRDLLARLRDYSASIRREVRRRQYYIGPSERRRLKARAAQRRAQRRPRFRSWVLVIRPLNFSLEEVMNATRPD